MPVRRDVNGSLEVAAHDFHLRGLAHGVVIHDCEPRHVHAHVRGRLVGATLLRFVSIMVVEHREDLPRRGCSSPVVFAVGLQVEGVDHVHVVEVGGRGLVGEVDRVVQRQVPDGERLVLGVAGRLRRACARGRAGRGRWPSCRMPGPGAVTTTRGASGLHVLVFAEALVGDDERGCRRGSLAMG